MPLTNYSGVHAVSAGSVKSLLCSRCKRILRDAIQVGCGHGCRYCALCYQELAANQRSSTEGACGGKRDLVCDECQRVINPAENFDDNYARREVNVLMVMCREADGGCEWKGTIKQYDDHYHKCSVMTVPCPALGCMTSMPRNQLFPHRESVCVGRVISCPFCDEKLRAADQDQHLKETCPKVQLICPNQCGAVDLLRDQLASHRKTCPREKVHCYYAYAGCGFHDIRTALPLHHEQNLAYHLQLISRMGEQNKEQMLKANVRLQEKNRELTGMVAMLREQQINVDRKLEAMQSMMDRFSQQMVTVVAHTGSTGCMAFSGITSPTSPPAMQGAASLPAITARLKMEIDALDGAMAVQDVQLSDLSIRQDLSEVKGNNGVLIWRIRDLTRRITDAESGRTPPLY